MENEILEEKIAKFIGVEPYDLEGMEFEISEDIGNDGTVYSYLIEFKGDSAKEINAFHPLESGKYLRVETWDLDDPHDYYNEDEFDAITSEVESYTKFRSALSDIRRLINIEIKERDLQELLYRQNYISVIGTLETYLSERLVNKIFSDEKYIKSFVLTHPEFKRMKFELREIFDRRNKLDHTVKKILLDQIYHNLPVVREMYNSTLEISFPRIKELMPFVTKRHDLVHRNGKTKEGVVLYICKDEIGELMVDVIDFVDKIEKEMAFV